MASEMRRVTRSRRKRRVATMAHELSPSFVYVALHAATAQARSIVFENLDCRLGWCEVFLSLKTALPDVVDRLLALPANRKRILKARQQWRGPGQLRSSLREACAVAACRALPGLAALYAGSYPSTEAPLKDIMKECACGFVPVRADDDDRDGVASGQRGLSPRRARYWASTYRRLMFY